MDVRCLQCGEINRLTTVEATEPQLCRRCGKLLPPPLRASTATVARERLLGESPLPHLPLRKAATPWPPEPAACELPAPRPPRPLPTPAPTARGAAAPAPLASVAPRRRRGSLLASLFWAFAVLALSLLATAQAVWQSPRLLDLHPMLRPLVERGCAEMGCTVPVRRDLTALQIQSSRLEALEGAPGLSELRVRLRNGAAFAQPLPGLRLTLLDDTQQPMAQRTLSPAEYQPGGPTTLGAGGSTEARVVLEDAGQTLAGFRVDLVEDPRPRGQSR